MTVKQQTAQKAVELLKQLYPNAKCSLKYNSSFQLLVAVRLSAQCTDARVNLVTPELFKQLPTAQIFKEADVKTIENLIKSCGLYKTTAKDLKATAAIICDKYNGLVPDTIEELIKLPGIGRKTANLICGDIYGKPAVVTDTHFIRISNRLGFVNSENPLIVEREMRKILPPDESNDFCHRIVLFGRDTCKAINPKCNDCILNPICKKKIKKKAKSKGKK